MAVTIIEAITAVRSSGGGGGSVTTNATLTGDGSAGNPLSVVNPEIFARELFSSDNALVLTSATIARFNCYTGLQDDAPNQARWTLPLGIAAFTGIEFVIFSDGHTGVNSPNSQNFFVQCHTGDHLQGALNGQLGFGVNRGVRIVWDGVSNWMVVGLIYQSYAT